MLVADFVMSAFVNDTPIVVLMIPILVGIALLAKLSVSGFMLPMGLATIIGGMSTTIGTSTNLLVVGITRDCGLAGSSAPGDQGSQGFTKTRFAGGPVLRSLTRH